MKSSRLTITTGEQPEESRTTAPHQQPVFEPVVRTKNLSKYFPIRTRWWSRKQEELQAVDRVSLTIAPGETVGLVGESGCGKSTLGRLILRLLDVTSGQIWLEGEEITHASQTTLRPLRRRMQIIFQDPYSSLNPRMTVHQILAEPLQIHKLARNKNEADTMIGELLTSVGLKPEMMKRYPHEFSGGQRQRIGIARALAVKPKFIVCDEPISALDVSIQAQIVNLLQELQEKRNLAYLFISHDLKIVQHMSQRVAVMYLGRVVELAPVFSLYNHTAHPYTKALISAIPILEPTQRRPRLILEGEPPNPMQPPTGCAFHPRCSRFQKGLCDVEAPVLRELKPGSGHWVACHFAEET